MRHNGIRFLSVILAAALFVPASPAAAPDRSISFRLTDDPATLDWNLAHTSHETHIIMNIMEGLVEQGPGAKPLPALAQRWEISPDGLTYTFHLRPDVSWSDGKPLKAQHFVDSWIRLLSPATKASYASFLFDLVNARAFSEGKVKDPSKVGVRALDDLRLEVKLTSITPYFIFVPSFWVTFPVRSDVIAAHGSSWAEPGKIVTLGPYLLKSWDHRSKIVLETNPGYYAANGAAEGAPTKVEAVIERDDAAARKLFDAGRIDFLLDATTEDVLRSRESGAAKVGQYPYLATFFLAFNSRKGALSDGDVRRAIALAIDRGSLPAVLQGGQIEARGFIPPGIEGHDAAVGLKGTLYDARGLLSRAGFPEARGLPKLILSMEKLDGAEKLAAFIAGSLREKLGIEVEYTVEGPSEFQKLRREGRFDMYVGHWGADFPDEANFFEVFSSHSGTNYTGWSDPKYDRSLETARATLDPATRREAFRTAEKILLEESVIILPLYHRKNAVLLGARIDRFEISPLNYLFLKRVGVRASP